MERLTDNLTHSSESKVVVMKQEYQRPLTIGMLSRSILKLHDHFSHIFSFRSRSKTNSEDEFVSSSRFNDDECDDE